MFFAIFTLAALYKLPFKLSLGSREQAEQTSDAVTLQQQSVITALVARFKGGLRCHCLKLLCHCKERLFHRLQRWLS